MSCRTGALWLALTLAGPACAQESTAPSPPPVPMATTADQAHAPANPATVPEQTPAASRSGREIYERFHEGLAEPGCDAGASSARWRAHFAHAPRQLATHDGEVLPLFGYVVDALRAAGLPTEYALIPFVESGYKPGARSPQGPAGLWQMITITARSHQIAIRAGYDGRLSPVDSTAAAVKYLRKLHFMFGGNWRLAVMGYNAGEYRVLGAIKRSGQTIRDARPESLPGLSPITQAYVRKLHALSCLMEQAHARGEWAGVEDKPVPRLEAVTLPDSAQDVAVWARRNGQDPARLLRLNPAYPQGRVSRAGGKPAQLLAYSIDAPAAPETVAMGATQLSTEGVLSVATVEGAQPLVLADASAPLVAETSPDPSVPLATKTSSPHAAAPRRHTVVRGDNPSRIAGRYGIGVVELLERNKLDARSVLHPGMVLLIDSDIVAGLPAAGTR